jgi:hypothetical protein
MAEPPAPEGGGFLLDAASSKLSAKEEIAVTWRGNEYSIPIGEQKTGGAVDVVDVRGCPISLDPVSTAKCRAHTPDRQRHARW